MSSRPRSHRANGGIDSVASSCSSDTSASGRTLEGVARSARAAPAARRPAAATARSAASVGRGQRGPGPLQRAVDRRRRWCPAARRPPRPTSSAPRAGSAPPAAAAAGAAARRRTPAGSTRARRRARPGRRRRAAPGRRDRLEPVVSGSGAPEAAARPGRTGRDPSAGRGAAGRCEHVEADVGGDPVEPGPQRRAALRTGRGSRQARTSVSCTASSASKRRAEHPVAVAGQLGAGAPPAAVPAPSDCPRRCRGPGRLLPRCVSYRLVPLRQRIPRHSATS